MKSKLREITHVQMNSGGFARSHSYYPAMPRRSASATKLWLQWVFVSGLGGLGGGLLALSMGVEYSLTAFVVITSIASVGQSILLKRFLKNANWWVLFSGLGAAVAEIFLLSMGRATRFVSGELNSVTRVLDFTRGTDWFALSGGILFLIMLILASLGTGSLIGLFQSFILQSRVARARVWIVTSALGALFAAIITGAIPIIIPLTPFWFVILNTGISQGLTACITGFALVRLLGAGG